jgi:myo-inositol-1(or 4)-monophosphatase
MLQKKINAPLILEAVRTVGDMFLKEYKQRPIPQDNATFWQLLNEIDDRCMTMLTEQINKLYPEIPWAGSEFDFEEQKKPLDMEEYWFADSMDGAIQYIQHIPGWTINIALIRNGKIHFSAIYDALQNEMFWALDGEGSFMNDKPLLISTKEKLKDMVAVFEYTHHENNNDGIYQKIGNSVSKLLENFGVVRNYGPHGLQLAYIGAGRIDLFHQEDLDTYNWLAGILIAKEAGAEILTTDGNPWQYGSGSLMVANKGIGKEFLQLITTK